MHKLQAYMIYESYWLLIGRTALPLSQQNIGVARKSNQTFTRS